VLVLLYPEKVTQLARYAMLINIYIPGYKSCMPRIHVHVGPVDLNAREHAFLK
jgi:hypothetical protein